MSETHDRGTVLSLAEGRAELRALSPDTIESLERAIAEGKAGNIIAIGLAFAFREDGGTTRWQTLECEHGHHVYLLGLVQRLTHAAGTKSINQSE